MPTSSYPIVLTDLSMARCVVIGGGAVAERKARQLIEAGARPTVISPAISEALAGWREAGQLEHIARAYAEGDLAGAALVIAATDDAAVNGLAAAEARRLGVLANIADDPGAGSFHTVATVRRGDLLISVSTGGASPGLAARLRRELEERYGPEYAELTRDAAARRPKAVRQ
jgi:precorrin-2 dehydrogenase/sirohydrochlorin ferrochelatase